MESGELTAVYCIGENPVSSEADSQHASEAARGPRHADRPGHLHDARPPRSPTWSSRPRTPRSSPRGPSRTPSAASSACARPSTPPGRREGRHLDHRPARGAPRLRLGRPHPRARPGTSSARCRRCTGHVVGAAGRDGRGPMAVLGRGPSWHAVPARAPLVGEPDERLRAAPFSVVIDDPPVDELTAQYPIRLTTGRRLDSYNTGVQTGRLLVPAAASRGDRALARGRGTLGFDRRRAGAGVVSTRGGRRARARHQRPATGARVHDHALPR